MAAAATAAGGDAAAAAIPRRVAGPSGEGGSCPQGAQLTEQVHEVREAAPPPAGGTGRGVSRARGLDAGGGESARARKEGSEQKRGHPDPIHPPKNSRAHGAMKYVWEDIHQ